MSRTRLAPPSETECGPRPFLKWAGGKAALVEQLAALFPARFNRYFEPFLGGGAVYFFLKQRFPKLQATLCDSNHDLINLYQVVRDDVRTLMTRLDDHALQFQSCGRNYFYDVRSQHTLTDRLDRAARTLFLNKTCFNGLWRVNRSGQFNTPIGSYQHPKLYDAATLLACSRALEDADIQPGDYQQAIATARSGDFVYFDPPYVPVSEYSDFKRYTAHQFRESDQVKLATVYTQLHARGCHVRLSNSDTTFVRDLYRDFDIHLVKARRAINCRADKRGETSELVVCNPPAIPVRAMGSKSSRKQSQVALPNTQATFPDTKFMGSKQRLLPFILEQIVALKPVCVMDAFAGSVCVSHAIKRLGVQVISNDLLTFSYLTAKATIENNATRVSSDELQLLLKPARRADTFVQDTFKDLYFSDHDNRFLDDLWARTQELNSPIKRALVLAAAARACMKKRPRGLFTFTGRKGWDGRHDLKLSMQEQFVRAVEEMNAAVFSNGKRNRACNRDVFMLPSDQADVVYIDTPYISPYSDCDYTRRYHFVEGYCTYWQAGAPCLDTQTRKIPSHPTAFGPRQQAHAAFARLFEHFRHARLVVSYSSNCIPNKDEMVAILKQTKRNVTVHEASHRYHSGNHAHKVGDNHSEVVEYLFVAT